MDDSLVRNLALEYGYAPPRAVPLAHSPGWILSRFEPMSGWSNHCVFWRVAQARERDRLEKWVAAAGPVEVDDHVLDFHRVTSPVYDMAAVEAACRRHGIPLRDIVRPDHEGIQRLGRAYPAWGEQVRQATTEQVSKQFTLEKEDPVRTLRPQ
jgi:hypothetical protein